MRDADRRQLERRQLEDRRAIVDDAARAHEARRGRRRLELERRISNTICADWERRFHERRSHLEA